MPPVECEDGCNKGEQRRGPGTPVYKIVVLGEGGVGKSGKFPATHSKYYSISYSVSPVGMAEVRD